jgi:hypoxanthine phosphoribosyltransferase
MDLKEGSDMETKMNRSVPGHYDEVYPAAMVAAGVKRVAMEIAPWAAEGLEREGQQMLALCVLRGAVFFFSDLLQAIPVSVEAGFCRCHAYEKGVNGQLAEGLKVEGLEMDLTGRRVLVVDDICDTGRTLEELSALCRARGAREVRTAVLIHRLIPESRFTPDHVAFRYEGREWFTGYGMDDRSWRTNYPSVYVLRSTGG